MSFSWLTLQMNASSYMYSFALENVAVCKCLYRSDSMDFTIQLALPWTMWGMFCVLFGLKVVSTIVKRKKYFNLFSQTELSQYITILATLVNKQWLQKWYSNADHETCAMTRSLLSCSEHKSVDMPPDLIKAVAKLTISWSIWTTSRDVEPNVQVL